VAGGRGAAAPFLLAASERGTAAVGEEGGKRRARLLRFEEKKKTVLRESNPAGIEEKIDIERMGGGNFIKEKDEFTAANTVSVKRGESVLR